MKLNRVYTFIIAAVLMLSACTDDFDSINKNPNLPENAAPDMLLVDIIRNTVFEATHHSFDHTSSYGAYITKFDYNDSERFIWGAFSNHWQTMYFRLRNTAVLKQLAIESENSSYQAIAMVMNAYIASTLTDMWGNVPYLNAGEGKTNANYTPEYNTQRDIYMAEDGILATLRLANELFKTSNLPVSGDIMFGGDLQMWRKFCNSLRLRYLIRVSAKEDVASEIQSILTEDVFFSTSDENARLEALGAKPNQSYVSMLREGDYNLWRMSDTMDELLHNLNDPRMNYFFDPAFLDDDNKPVYKGYPVGITFSTAEDLGVDQNQASRLSRELFFNTPDGFDYWYMNAAEVQFIFAEAAKKGLIAGGDALAESYYNKGIEMAFAMYNIEMPADYMSNILVSYESNTAISQILTQKWLANFGVANEGWLEFKRTGYPLQKTNIDNVNVVDGNALIPSRYLYPADEQLNNKENYQKALQLMGGSDDINYSHWWEE